MTFLVPHHPTLALAEVEAQRAADLTGRPFIVWCGLPVAGAGKCWTVTSATRDFPACCRMRQERTVHPRQPRGPGGPRP